MNFFTFTKLGRALLLAGVLAVGSVCWLGCGGGDDNNPADNSGNNSNNSNNNGGDANHDGRLINAANGEAWLEGRSCESATHGFIFKSNGDLINFGRGDGGDDGGPWTVWTEVMWRTDGNKLTMRNPSFERGETATYEVSNSTLTLTNDSNQATTYKKCSGVVVGG